MRQLITVERDSAEQAASSDEPGMGGAYRADLRDPGLLDHITFRRCPRNAPRDGDIEIELKDELSPSIIRKGGDEGYIYVLMPMRL